MARGRAGSANDDEALRFIPFCADRVFDHLPVAPGDKMLDVATGTGAVATAAALRVRPGGRVTGIDNAEETLAQAHRHVERLGLDNVDLHIMDAASIEFRSNYFHATVCSYGLFLLPDMRAALREWRRVTRPGGSVLFTAFARSAFQPVLDLFVGRLESLGVSVADILGASVRNGSCDPDACRRLLVDAGLVDVELRTEQLGYHVRTMDHWWEIVRRSGLRALVDAIPVDTRARFRDEHLAELEALASDRGLWLDAATHFVWGRKPV